MDDSPRIVREIPYRIYHEIRRLQTHNLCHWRAWIREMMLSDIDFVVISIELTERTTRLINSIYIHKPIPIHVKITIIRILPFLDSQLKTNQTPVKLSALSKSTSMKRIYECLRSLNGRGWACMWWITRCCFFEMIESTCSKPAGRVIIMHVASRLSTRK